MKIEVTTTKEYEFCPACDPHIIVTPGGALVAVMASKYDAEEFSHSRADKLAIARSFYIVLPVSSIKP